MFSNFFGFFLNHPILTDSNIMDLFSDSKSTKKFLRSCFPLIYLFEEIDEIVSKKQLMMMNSILKISKESENEKSQITNQTNNSLFFKWKSYIEYYFWKKFLSMFRDVIGILIG